jgi:putative flippase GtrA
VCFQEPQKVSCFAKKSVPGLGVRKYRYQGVRLVRRSRVLRIADAVLARLPEPLQALALKHRELLKFATVGGTAFLVDNTVFYGLKLTILEPKPVTAKVIAVLMATIVSYVLNREWSFRTRGGRERRHEAALFFLVSGVGLVLSSAPLWISRYVFRLETPDVSLVTQEIADFMSAQIIGTLIAMVFRFWALRKWVFPDEKAQPGSVRLAPTPDSRDEAA